MVAFILLIMVGCTFTENHDFCTEVVMVATIRKVIGMNLAGGKQIGEEPGSSFKNSSKKNPIHGSLLSLLSKAPQSGSS